MSGTESVKVVVRCRALQRPEIEEEQKNKNGQNQVVVHFYPDLNQVSVINPNHPIDSSSNGSTNNMPRLFTFDAVYGFDSTTEQIYDEVAFPIVESAFEGYNGTIFAYGQTGCGKSFTMQGDLKNPQQTIIENDSNHTTGNNGKSMSQGIIQRAFEHILEAVAATKDFKFLLRASYIEIYNDEIHDLLAPISSGGSGGGSLNRSYDGPNINRSSTAKQLNKVELRRGIITDANDADHHGAMENLTIMNVQTLEDCLRVIRLGFRNRSVSATLMNSDSSRSHSILTIYIERIQIEENGRQLGKQHLPGHVRRGKLHLVDLAGSERLSRTGAVGDRLKEATKINLSLSALGNVISRVADHANHIPYRDSKLTRLLQDSLGGNAKTLMIACIAPTLADYSETLCTLAFARRAKSIKNKPVINQDAKDSVLEGYKIEIDRLRALLADLEARQKSQQPISGVLEPQPATGDNNQKRRSTMIRPSEFKQQLEGSKDADKLQSEIDTNEEANNLNGDNNSDQFESYNESEEDNDKDLEESRQFLKAKQQSLDEMREKALERLNKLQSQLVGGERADDEYIKMKRSMRARMAKKKFDALSSALAKLNDDDQKLVKAFGNVSEELANKTGILRNAELRIASLEQEIGELTREFELDRSDLATRIYKQSKERKFFKQLSEFIFNYAIDYNHEYFVNFNRSHRSKYATNQLNGATGITNNENGIDENNNQQLQSSPQKNRLRTTNRGQQQSNGGIITTPPSIDQSTAPTMAGGPSEGLDWDNGLGDEIWSPTSESSSWKPAHFHNPPTSFLTFVQFIRSQSNWSEFEHKWLLPDAQKLQIAPDKLPETGHIPRNHQLVYNHNDALNQAENKDSQEQQQQSTDNSSRLWQKLQERNSKESLIAYFKLNKTAHLTNGKK